MATSKRHQLATKIGRDLYLQDEVVLEVMDRLIDYMVEEAVQTGTFKLFNFFSISTMSKKGFTSPIGEVPSQEILKVKLTQGLRDLFRVYGKTDTVNRDNWREILRELNEEKHGKVLNTSRVSGGSRLTEAENPFLEEDDDY